MVSNIKKVMTYFRMKKKKTLHEPFKAPIELPKEVKLLKNLPGIKAGAIFILGDDGAYSHEYEEKYAAYDWWTVSNLTDWWKPLNAEEKGRWYD